MRRLVAVMTDFGISDPYAGQVNAVLSAYSDLPIVSITHHVPPHNVALGAHILDASLDKLARSELNIDAAIIILLFFFIYIYISTSFS